MKFIDDPEYMEAIRQTDTAASSKKMGGSRSHKLREDWEEAKIGVMEEALLLKFTQHEDLKAKLFATGTAVLIEDAPCDKYWGDGGDGTGVNKLGQLLVKLRESLKEQAD